MKSRRFKIQNQPSENLITEFKSVSSIDLFGKSKVTGGYAPIEDDENTELFGKILINKPQIPDWKKIIICY
jgi:hypothetical protein